MNLSLTPQLENFVRDRAQSGDYSNASEVVREALRLFKRSEDERAEKMACLRGAIEEGEQAIQRGNPEFSILKKIWMRFLLGFSALKHLSI